MHYTQLSAHRSHTLQAKLLLTLALALLTGACMAPLEERLGYADEPCSADRQCRPELLCRQGVCKPTAPEVVSSCRRICARFVDGCGRIEASCVEQDPKGCCLSSCSSFIERWRQDAIGRFEACSRELLTCAEVRSVEAANLCYVQLNALPDERLDVCIGLVQRAQMTPSVSFSAEVVDNTCRIVGRAGKDEDWLSIEACADPSLEDEAFARCLERSFRQAQPSFE